MSSPVMHSIFRTAKASVRHSPDTFFTQARASSWGSYVPSPLQQSTAGKRQKSGKRFSPACAFEASPQALRRSFSTTTPARATVVRLNPRQDEEGKDMTIEISARAAKRLKQITSAQPSRNTLVPSPSSEDSVLRITVTSGGCHGFQYLMSLESASKIDDEEDTVFDYSAEGPAEGRAEVVMDSASLELLKGSTVDFTTELIGSQFKIVGNPRAKSSCGCGTSFDVE